MINVSWEWEWGEDRRPKTEDRSKFKVRSWEKMKNEKLRIKNCRACICALDLMSLNFLKICGRMNTKSALTIDN